MTKFTFYISFLFVSTYILAADSIFRIEVGKDYKEYSNTDLQRRVWELERAVMQLQMKVFQLEMGQNTTLPSMPKEAESWSCTIHAMGEDFVGTGLTKALANSNAMDKCKTSGKDAFFCKNPSCSKD